MRSRSPILVVIIGVALAGLVILNIGISRFGQRPGHEDEDEQPAQAAQNASSASNASRRAAEPDTGAAGKEESLATVPPEYVVGAGTAPRDVVVGWSWTPEVQANPSKVLDAVRAVQATNPGSKVRFVNTDVHPEVPRGIQVDGKKVSDLGPDGSVNPIAVVQAAGPPGGPSAPPGAPGPPGPPLGAPPSGPVESTAPAQPH